MSDCRQLEAVVTAHGTRTHYRDSSHWITRARELLISGCHVDHPAKTTFQTADPQSSSTTPAPLVAEHQRRLGPRVSTRQDRVIERRDGGGRSLASRVGIVRKGAQAS